MADYQPWYAGYLAFASHYAEHNDEQQMEQQSFWNGGLHNNPQKKGDLEHELQYHVSLIVHVHGK